MAEITLHYFNFYARAEVIRLILVHHGVEFRDNRVSFEDWPALRETGVAEFGQLPALEIDGLKLVESKSIARYVSQKYGYYPTEASDVYWVESLCDLKSDIMDAFAKAFMGPNAEEDLAKLATEEVPGWLALIEARLNRNNGGEGWFVGDNLTRADFEIFEFLWDLFLRKELEEKGYAKAVTPKLLAYVNRVLEHSPRIKAYLENRPQCPF